MRKWIFEGTAIAAKVDGSFILKSIPRVSHRDGKSEMVSATYPIKDEVRSYIEKILNGREEVYIRVNIWDSGEVDFFEEVDTQGSKVADLPPVEEEEDGV